MNTPKTINPTITLKPITKAESNLATRKIAEETAIREVSRAVTAWYYTC